MKSNAVEVTVAAFRALLAALHDAFSSRLAPPPGSVPTHWPACLSRMLFRLMLAQGDQNTYNTYCWGGMSAEEAVARACAALLLGSADFRADLAAALTHGEEEVASLALAAQVAISMDEERPGSAQARAFRSDRRLVEALLARLVADAGASEVRGSEGGGVARTRGWRSGGPHCLPLVQAPLLHALMAPPLPLLPLPAGAQQRDEMGSHGLPAAVR